MSASDERDIAYYWEHPRVLSKLVKYPSLCVKGVNAESFLVKGGWGEHVGDDTLYILIDKFPGNKYLVTLARLLEDDENIMSYNTFMTMTMDKEVEEAIYTDMIQHSELPSGREMKKRIEAIEAYAFFVDFVEEVWPPITDARVRVLREKFMRWVQYVISNKDPKFYADMIASLRSSITYHFIEAAKANGYKHGVVTEADILAYIDQELGE